MAAASPPRTRVVVLFGGRSAEHEVSLLSARNVVQALDRARFDPVLVGIGRDGRWRLQSEATLLAAVGDPRGLALSTEGAPFDLAEVARDAQGHQDLVVFPVLHGTFGEDGTVQGLFELCDVAYVGSGVLGSALGMDKDAAKRVLRDAGIPVVPSCTIGASAWRRDRAACEAAAAKLGFPLFVKPANAGSSVGVSKVARAAALGAAVEAALAFDRKVLCETAVDAREIECAVLGNDEPEASVPGEIVVHHKDGFYSYDAKYVDADGATPRIPADLPADVAARVRALSVAAFTALDLAGMARVDFFLDRRDGALYLNEVNTIPGFTAISMYPKMWEASGLPVTKLVCRLIDLAAERHEVRRRLRTSPAAGGV